MKKRLIILLGCVILTAGFMIQPVSAGSLTGYFTGDRGVRAETASDSLWKQAYLELLRQEQKFIDLYDWQKTAPWDYTEENRTRAVALCDIWGDEMPELIYVKIKGDGSEMFRASTIQIVTFLDGQVQTLLSQDWDSVVGGGFDYYLFQRENEKTLYAVTVYGDEYSRTTFSILTQTEEGMQLKELYQEYLHPGEVIDSVLTMDSDYYEQGKSIPQEYYTGAVQEFIDTTECVLMSSETNRFPQEAALYIAQNGSSALTAQEMINLLLAQSTAVPNDLTTQDLNALEMFFSYYAWQGDSYDCTVVTQPALWRNILEAVIRHPAGIQDEIYPGEPVQDIWQGSDPLGRWPSYRRYSEEKADWILTNIFHVSEQDLEVLKAADADTQENYLLDGYYYSYLGGIGGGYMASLTDLEYDGERYAVWFDLQNYYDFEGTDIQHLCAVMEYRVIDGTGYWSMYYMGDTLPEE